eukprot:TRINITY_DN38737_c0_g1_i1.p1 TRINITY_DN38737_c0_g1~~TRINITY_DN38737_c0_g1_i1.p1  ORF type:complete len:407 (-),score=75.37 TRINITY_DN38737_c0_g1_i1:100-1320(-)
MARRPVRRALGTRSLLDIEGRKHPPVRRRRLPRKVEPFLGGEWSWKAGPVYPIAQFLLILGGLCSPVWAIVSLVYLVFGPSVVFRAEHWDLLGMGFPALVVSAVWNFSAIGNGQVRCFSPMPLTRRRRPTAASGQFLATGAGAGAGAALDAQPAGGGAPLSIFVLVPGFGDPTHAPRLLQNVALLRAQPVDLACVIYVWRSEEQLPIATVTEFAPCVLKRQKGQWVDFLRAAPEELWVDRDYVLLWFDDAVMVSLDLPYWATVMRCNHLSVLSPTYSPAQPRTWQIMEYDKSSLGGVGRHTDFVEFQITMFTPASFSCLRSLANKNTTLGWGIDMIYARKCPGHCIGLLDNVVMIDTATGSYNKSHAQVELKQFNMLHGGGNGIYYNFRRLVDPSKGQCFSDPVLL